MAKTAKTTKAARGGRPHWLTREAEQRTLDAIRAGATMEDAAAAAGVSRRTLHRWTARGQGDDAPAPFRQFAEAVEHARASARVSAIRTIRRAMDEGDWGTRLRAACFFLERTDPANWGRRTAHELTGRDGKAITVHDEGDSWDLRRLSDEELDQLNQLRSKATDG
jgi:hypothetical protein